MRLVIVGATGFLGARLLRVASERMPTLGTSREAPGLQRLDLSQPEAYDYSTLVPGDVVALAGGLSSPDVCAREYDRAWALNVEGTARFIDRAIARGVRVIFFSSDTVYGERDTAFDEGAPCAPLGEYAKMKHEVERRFQGNAAMKALRLSYVFAAEDVFTAYLRSCAAARRAADIFHPFHRAVVHREDVVQAVIGLAERWDEFAAPALNAGGPDILSRIEFAQAMKDTVLPQLEWKVVQPAAQFFTQRPRSIAMQSPALQRLLGRPARNLRQAIESEFKQLS